ncbi:MAG TPA: glycosyltransferase family 2 protein [Ilumatobacter sp.]|nr:glycosyltransferase family 2 protein [Ilumatobacter sp.]
MTDLVESAPAVTVCIPAFDAEAVIERAIRSVTGQAVAGSIEILVCDDGSTDRTGTILNELQAELPGLRLLTNARNMGRPYTRNRLMAEARGRFLTWLDADDEKYPGMLAAQVDKLEEIEREHGADALAGLLVFTNFHWWRPTMGRPRVVEPAVGDDPMEHLLSAQFGGYLWLMMGTTDSWRAVGSFDESLPRLQDLAFFIRFAELGGRFVRVDSDAPLCVYHKEDAGRDAAAVWASWNRIWRKYRHHFESYGMANARAWRRNHYRVSRRFARANGDDLTFARVALWEVLFVVRGRLRRVLFDA